jgi:hypothetical protein
MSKDNGIITRAFRPLSENTPHLTTINEYAPPTCEASENGVDCFRHAEYDYLTSTGETRYLCKLHWNAIWDIIAIDRPGARRFAHLLQEQEKSA